MADINKKIRKGILLAGLTALVSSSLSLSGCGGCQNDFNDMGRNLIKRDYEITLYSATGNTIMQKTINKTYVRLGENGSGIRYLEDGKLVLLNGTYIVREK